MTINLDKTLTQLEKEDWGEPKYDSYLVKTCHALRNKPLKELSIEDLRILIGQNISLNYLIPIAIEKLTQNILAEGDFYSGDLLKSVLDSEASFWTKNKTLWEAIRNLYNNNKEIFENDNIYRQISKSFDVFDKIFS